nr:MAG TPA: hypothetical protein [Caudoviricetes sp.]
MFKGAFTSVDAPLFLCRILYVSLFKFSRETVRHTI